MTTQAAAELYLAQYVAQCGTEPIVFNPHSVDPSTLPTIYGFVNGGRPGWYNAVVIAEDGEVLGGHVCSDPGYAPGDLGVVAGGLGESRHARFRAHYPDGYRMEYVSYEKAGKHEGLKKAFELNLARQQASTEVPNP